MTHEIPRSRRSRTAPILSVALAALTAFVAAWLWYLLFAEALASLPADGDAAPPAAALFLELGRTLLVAAVLAHLVAQLRAGVGSALGLAILLWLGFPVVLLLGSVLWEGVPWRLAAIHAGDWLVKLSLMGVILGAWRARTAREGGAR